MAITVDDVLRIVRTKGPIIPNRVKQELKQPDPTLVNVFLSDLLNEKKVKRTNVKLGSSFFYYTPDQKAKIEPLVQHLNEKQRRVAAQLKQEGVMRSATQDPLTRVCLQDSPDFAIPVHVKTGQGEEIFYRWFLFDPAQAQEKIKVLLGARPAQEPAVEKPTPEQKQEQATKEPEEARAEQEPKPVKQKEQPTAQKSKKKESQKPLAIAEPESNFAKDVVQYCKDKDIDIIELEETRKDSEVDMVVLIPSAIGRVKYFCRAKNKKTSNDGDIASAILSAKAKMLPAMYLTTGTVTKKAKTNPELQECVVVEWE